MRRMTMLLPALVVSGCAGAAAQQVDRIDVTEYGIYTGTTTSQQTESHTAAGVVAAESDIRHAVTTRTVPAQQFVQFGFRYVVEGAPAGQTVELRMVTIFPPPGLTNPATGQLSARSEFDVTAIIGAASFRSYDFKDAWEAIPGPWTMQVWYQGRMLAEQKFTVVNQ